MPKPRHARLEPQEPERPTEEERLEFHGTLDEYVQLADEDEDAANAEWERTHPKQLNTSRYKTDESYDPNMGCL